MVATFQSDDNFGRILAAYGGIFVAGSIAWGMVADGYRPDRYDVIGALVCLAGMTVIMYAPRSNGPGAPSLRPFHAEAAGRQASRALDGAAPAVPPLKGTHRRWFPRSPVSDGRSV